MSRKRLPHAQGADRQVRSPFEAVFLRNGEGAGVVHSRRLPASVAKQYLFNLKTRVESRGPQTDVDFRALAHIYGNEMDMLAGAVILNYWAFDGLGNADPEALQNLTAEILRSIDAAIDAEQCDRNYNQLRSPSSLRATLQS